LCPPAYYNKSVMVMLKIVAFPHMAVPTGKKSAEPLDKYIEVRYIIVYRTSMHHSTIYGKQVTDLEDRIRRIYVPMTETGFYILLCLQRESHGYGIGQRIRDLTDGALVIGPGTMYGTLSKMEKDGLICFSREADKRKFYIITEAGREVLQLEKQRIRHLYKTVEEDEAQ